MMAPKCLFTHAILPGPHLLWRQISIPVCVGAGGPDGGMSRDTYTVAVSATMQRDAVEFETAGSVGRCWEKRTILLQGLGKVV